MINKPFTFLTNVQNYIRFPKYQQPLADRPGSHLATTVRQFLAEYPLVLSLLIISAGTTVFAHYATGQETYKPIMQRLISSFGISMVALPLAVVFEETVFRAILRVTPNRLRNAFALLLWIPLGYYYQPIKELTNDFALLWLIPVWAGITYLIGRYLKRPVVFARIDDFWQSNFSWIFYGAALLYAFGKIINNVGTLIDGQVLLLFMLLLIGLLKGIYFGYVRMTYGFWYAVAVHMLLMIAALAPEVIRNL